MFISATMSAVADDDDDVVVDTVCSSSSSNCLGGGGSGVASICCCFLNCSCSAAILANELELLLLLNRDFLVFTPFSARLF